MATTTPKKETITQIVALLVEAVKVLETKIDALSVLVTEKFVVENVVQEELPQSEEVLGTPEPDIPALPHEWRAVIDETLSPLFGASVVYRDDARFELTIMVPKEYSNASSREWEVYKEDRRAKVLDNHLGSIGVRDYANLIAENLGAEIRAKIADDRARFLHAQSAHQE